MMNLPDPKPREHLHTKKCLAHAVICAVENLRDTNGTDLEFRVHLQDNLPLEWADSYLSDGTVTCLCPEPTPAAHPNPCEGHESLAGEHMGETVFCDGSCVPTITHLRRLAPTLRTYDRVTDDVDKVTCEHCLDQM